MTNLDSIFKSRDVTLPTKVHLVKAMVFPVVMYGCESWTQRNSTFVSGLIFISANAIAVLSCLQIMYESENESCSVVSDSL